MYRLSTTLLYFLYMNMSDDAIWWFIATNVAKTLQLLALITTLTLTFGAIRHFFMEAMQISGVVNKSCTINLVQQIIKACLPGDMPNLNKVGPLFYLLLRDKEVLPSLSTRRTFRFEGMDFLNYGPPTSFWPPSLGHGESCSAS
jgi:hypothetical protein